MFRSASFKHLALGLSFVSIVAVGGSGIVLAQDEEEPSVSHPAHVHKGDCTDLDPNPAGPLSNVEPRLNEDAEDEDANAPQGALTATSVHFSETEGVELAFDDLLAESHAINVHESEENVQNYIACGDIGGVVVDDQLVIALHPQNDSGYFGVAIVEKDGDDKVNVRIYLSEPGEATDATPVS